ESGSLYLSRAIASVRRQAVMSDAEIIVGLSDVPGFTHESINYVVAKEPGQAAALNAAVGVAGDFDLLAFLEDDDYWEPRKLEYQLEGIKAGYDLVTSNQREVDPEGNFIRVNDFATPSGWLMTRQAWEKVGPFDPAFRWHLDNDWLGRFNRSGLKRLHMVEAGANVNPHPWLQNVMQFSKAATTEEREPMVVRTINPKGGMAKIQGAPTAARESYEEHRVLIERYGCVPW